MSVVNRSLNLRPLLEHRRALDPIYYRVDQEESLLYPADLLAS